MAEGRPKLKPAPRHERENPDPLFPDGAWRTKDRRCFRPASYASFLEKPAIFTQ